MISSKTNTVNFVKHNEEAKAPTYSTVGSAGADLFSIENKTIPPWSKEMIDTGISVEFESRLVMSIVPRSGLAVKNNITVLNSPGTIDSDYRGNIKIILMNLSNEPFKVEKGNKIAQAIFIPVEHMVFWEAKELSNTERNSGGFGSTGR